MTLVLSCITPEFVVQVSDRRLTRLDGTLYDDETNKAVLLYQNALFAYTGLGHIGSKPTNIWIADTLHRFVSVRQNPNDLSDAPLFLGREATKVFQRIPGGLQLKRHDFVSVGWAAWHADPDKLQPFYMTISNALDSTGKWLSLAKREFEMRFHLLASDEPFYFAANGQSLSTAEDASIRRNLRRALARGRGQSSVSRLLATLIDVVASRNKLVGRGLLISVLPVGAVRQEQLSFQVLLASRSAFYLVPSTTQPTFIQVPADRSSPFRYVPTLVTSQGVAEGITIDMRPGWIRNE